MNLPLHRFAPLSRILSLAAAVLFAPAAAGAFTITAKLERDGNGFAGPGESACTSCPSQASRVSTSFAGGFPPPGSPVAEPANSEISGTAFVDLRTGVMHGNSHAVSFGNLEPHQMRFVSRLEETITITLPPGLPVADRVVTLTGEVTGGASATNRATASALYLLQLHNLSAAASTSHLADWHVTSGAGNPAIVITPVPAGYRFRLTSVIPTSRVVIITSQVEGTAWAEARFATGVGIADVTAGTTSLSMILPPGATYTSTSGGFLTSPAIQAWRQQYFGTDENSGPGADDADPDNDGTVNLLEFATHTSPMIATTPPISQVRNGQNLEFSYIRNKAALNGVTFAVESSDAPGTAGWTSEGVTEVIQSDDGTVQQIKATLPAGTSRRFVRLSVTAAP